MDSIFLFKDIRGLWKEMTVAHCKIIAWRDGEKHERPQTAG
jgi:hypothetical protein